jgi:heptosyltransferase-2
MLNCEIVITGGKEEKALMEQLAQLIPNGKIGPSQLGVRSFAALIDQADLLVCNDTGPFHLACALNKPVVGIYSSTDPAVCGPLHPTRATVISKPPTCTPCLKRGCLSPFCFLQIGVEEVLEGCLKALTK